jgi:uncharacterized protein (DUF2141 family)
MRSLSQLALSKWQTYENCEGRLSAAVCKCSNVTGSSLSLSKQPRGVGVAHISSSVAAAAFVSRLASAQANEFTITLTRIGPTGKMLDMVLEDTANFGGKKKAVAVFVDSSANGRAAALVHDLAPGRYAVALFQEVKGTGKIATNFYGVPTPFDDFSSEATGTLWAPGLRRGRYRSRAERPCDCAPPAAIASAARRRHVGRTGVRSAAVCYRRKSVREA